MEEKQGFDEWAVVELFGHQRIVGRASDANIGGASMLRVDVPAVDGKPAFTKFYGPGAIYAITPVEEAIARAMAASLRAIPIDVYALPEAARAALEPPRRPSTYVPDDDMEDDYTD